MFDGGGAGVSLGVKTGEGVYVSQTWVGLEVAVGMVVAVGVGDAVAVGDGGIGVSLGKGGRV